MFSGFPEETIRFFLDLRYHNDLTWFHSHREEYEQYVRAPFKAFIEEMVPVMSEIAPDIEMRPVRCLARINRDIRFTRDKSPYRDHLWILFRRAGEERQGSAMYWFELSPANVIWGLGFWDATRETMDCLRDWMTYQPEKVLSAFRESRIPGEPFELVGDRYKRMAIPETVPETLRPLYPSKDIGVIRQGLSLKDAYSPDLAQKVGEDYLRLKPLYTLFREAADSGRTEKR